LTSAKQKAPAEADAFCELMKLNYLTAAFSFEPAETLTVFAAAI